MCKGNYATVYFYRYTRAGPLGTYKVLLSYGYRLCNYTLVSICYYILGNAFLYLCHGPKHGRLKTTQYFFYLLCVFHKKCSTLSSIIQCYNQIN